MQRWHALCMAAERGCRLEAHATTEFFRRKTFGASETRNRHFHATHQCLPVAHPSDHHAECLLVQLVSDKPHEQGSTDLFLDLALHGVVSIIRPQMWRIHLVRRLVQTREVLGRLIPSREALTTVRCSLRRLCFQGMRRFFFPLFPVIFAGQYRFCDRGIPRRRCVVDRAPTASPRLAPCSVT